MLETLMNEALKLRIGSGIALSFGKIDDLKTPGKTTDLYFGQTFHGSAVKVSSDSIYDVASLSKILATTLLTMKKVEMGQVTLDSTIENLLPVRASQNSDLKSIKVRNLLTHSSGLPAWRAFYEEMKVRFGSNLLYVDTDTRKKYFDDLVFSVKRENEIGDKAVYSDIGILILENILSESSYRSEVEALWSMVPAMKLHYRPVLGFARDPKVVATENCPWRGLLQGQVHDDNSWSRGGISAHAGVFGRLSDLKLWISNLMSETWVSRATLQEFSEEWVGSDGTHRGLGFDLPPRDGSGSTALAFSPNTIGHLGFTGTSLWIDLDSGDYAILLTNRVHPQRNDLRIRALRREFHQLIR